MCLLVLQLSLIFLKYSLVCRTVVLQFQFFFCFHFNKRICSDFPSLYSPSRFPSCHCLSRLAIVLDKDPSTSDFVLHSNKCGKIIAACIAKVFLLFSIRLFKFLLRVSMK